MGNILQTTICNTDIINNNGIMCIDSSIDITIDYSNSVSTDFCFAITKDSSDSLTTILKYILKLI